MSPLRCPMVAALMLLGVSPGIRAEPFTVVALPDTQSYVHSDELAEGFLAQTEWIRAQSALEDIRFVTQLGDIVSSGGAGVDGNRPEWRRADRAMSVLDATSVPWGIAVGNHELDRVDVLGSGYARYREFFGPATTGRFDGKSWFGGASENELNTYQLFSAGGRDYLFLHLELDVPDDAIAWARGILETHPNRATLVSTHIYLGSRFPAPYLPGPGRNSREDIFAKLIAPHRQIFLILNGHDGGERSNVSINDYGGEVLELLQDYAGRPNGGDGWLRLLRIDETAGEVRIETFTPGVPRNPSPRFERDENSEFTWPLDFAARFDTPLDGPLPPPETTLLDGFETDTSGTWQPSQAAGAEGTVVVTEGKLELRPQARQTLLVVQAEPALAPGAALSMEVNDPESRLARALFLVSSRDGDPLGPGALALAVERRGTDLRVLRYDDGMESATPVTEIPEGPLIFWIERTSFIDFDVYYQLPGASFRRFVTRQRLFELVDSPRLFAGVGTWSSRGDPQRFDDLRRASGTFDGCPQDGPEAGDTRCLGLDAVVEGDGKLRLTSGANNTVSAMLDDGMHSLRPGSAWGIDIEGPGNAFFMASTRPAQPDGTESFGFRLRRDASWRIATIDRAASELIDTGVEGADGPSGTMWIERLTDTDFRFSFEAVSSGNRRELGRATNADLAGVAELFVGVQFFDTSRTSFLFDNLRSGPLPAPGDPIEATLVDDFSSDTTGAWRLTQSFGSGGTFGINTQIVSLTASASDATDDTILYTFTAERLAADGSVETVERGPQREPTTQFDASDGSWVFSVRVDDDRTCPDQAPDAVCAETLEIGPAAPLFRRGDADSSGRVNIVDAIAVLDGIFGRAEPIGCFDAFDTDDSGALEITDALLLLRWLFRGDGRIPPPGPEDCGPDGPPDEQTTCVGSGCGG